ncbi:MAG TPA: arginine--tRNA ligase [Candidatus Saccharimonadales bacterium]|nr:arginine--tRNA ligase [Candidatus Saccharimonadales bacterium]
MQKIQQILTRVIQKVFNQHMQPELSRPDEQFGDFSTNVALQLAGKIGKKPREVAEELVEALQPELAEIAADISIAGPGFINIRIKDHLLLAAAAVAPESKPDTYKDKVVVAEYSDPNPFKVLHAGHLYTTVVGDAVANLLQEAGGKVHRVNFGGDVGLHVGRTMWAILQELGGEHPEKLSSIPKAQRSIWLSQQYVKGSNAYSEDAEAKEAIIKLNKRVYQLHEKRDHTSPFAQIYWTTREWSYDAFDAIYKRLNVSFEKYYPESETTELGIKTVREQLKKGVFQESDGAVVFKGEPYGLHTRVFINSNGLPTYEAKDIGLIMTKWNDYKFDISTVITGNDIVEYMKVVLKSIEQFAPELSNRSKHLTHGMVKMAGRVKMSSRKGNILRGDDILDAAAEATKKATGQINDEAVLAAVKYAFLKQRIGGDIIYDPEESVSLEGNSGPYLQYAHARACSILQKTTGFEGEIAAELEPAERSLARKISEYPEVIQKSVADMMPHYICTYLYELAQTFNRFYEHNRVVGNERQATRQLLVQLYADVLKDGLRVLNIPAPVRL